METQSNKNSIEPASLREMLDDLRRRLGRIEKDVIDIRGDRREKKE